VHLADRRPGGFGQKLEYKITIRKAGKQEKGKSASLALPAFLISPGLIVRQSF
jgi:hypothetical protein